MTKQKLKWAWKGPWCTSGNGNWTTEMSDLKALDNVDDAFLPGTDTLWTEVEWTEFRDSNREDFDGWEWKHPDGRLFVIFND